MKIKEPHIHGSVNFRSNLSIEEVGKIIGDKVFSGAVFSGKEKYIYEEVPAIYIDNLMLGFLFVIQGYSGINNENGYSLNMTPYFSIRSIGKYDVGDFIEVNMDYYLYALLTERLQDHPDIQIIEPQNSQS
jgi:hypothetical protein